MIAVKMQNGDLFFEKIRGEEEFWQRVVNTLKIYNIECFYNQNLGVDISILHEQEVDIYKLEHIKAKIQELYKKEVVAVEYKILAKTERVLKARISILHKEYSKITKEVTIHAKI